jgi:hypothetical protein
MSTQTATVYTDVFRSFSQHILKETSWQDLKCVSSDIPVLECDGYLVTDISRQRSGLFYLDKFTKRKKY